jgi:translation initiation factor IF-2
LDKGHCEIFTFVPQAASAQDAAGNPTVYQVVHSPTDQRQTGEFSVNQTANRGQWVDGGAFAFDHGQLAVKLGNRGTGAGGARHAAAQLRLRCGG